VLLGFESLFGALPVIQNAKVYDIVL